MISKRKIAKSRRIASIYSILVLISLIVIIIANYISGCNITGISNSIDMYDKSQVSMVRMDSEDKTDISNETSEQHEEVGQRQSTASNNQNNCVKNNVVLDDITYQDVYALLYSSKHLTEDEKAFLDNENLINDVLFTINKNNINKRRLLYSLKNIDIHPYTDADEHTLGYYDPSRPNVINVKNYTELGRIKKDTISHEYIHLLQYDYLEYNMLNEACAEIVSSEYFEDAKDSAYSDYIYLTKKLMEIIGPVPVWVYTFTGDFSLIESNVSPYFDKNEYNAFLDCIKSDEDNSYRRHSRVDKLNTLLDTLYKRKYDDYASNDKVIPLLGNPNLKRYYFNKRLINRENSYYEDGKTITTVSMTMDEAIKNGYVYVEEEIKENIPRERIKNYLVTHYNKGLMRRCVYVQGFSETEVLYRNGKIIVTGHLNCKEYNDVPENQLIEEGVIEDCHYYYVKDKKKLSYDEYKNNKFDPDNKLNFFPDRNKCYEVSLNGTGEVNISLSSKTYLAPIYEKFQAL